MHPEVYYKFEEILVRNNINGKVLEIGAVPSNESLLASKTLDKASEKIGLNINKAANYKDFKIIEGNSNNMEQFNDETFDCIISNATLEHDKFFWKSISEMKRILKKGGLLIIGCPSYVQIDKEMNYFFKKFLSLLLKAYYRIVKRNPTYINIDGCTACLRVHNFPGDYYRFSNQTFKEVFFKGFNNVTIETIMLPPRTIAYGYKI